MRSKRYTALEKGSIRNLCCGGAWTADRAAEVGYQLSDEQLLCPLCRAHPDSVHHRLYECPVVSETRSELIPPEILEVAL
eukprot:8057415-Pyramimonas_sp.AAC.1